MKKPRTSVTKCMTLRLSYTSSLTGLLTVICDASGKNICITMPYYVCAITDGKLGYTSDAEDEEMTALI
ncbi:hypothetical protein T01_1101 [Trichinella spiralis]|uniref:Uncharacterized protein n=1 Tax=Trichinella spiralis TaxID=6334 RepID=A0A0V1BJ17_TRISP|nr:hypothetical protein T01_1101 [Trichinella spiralis]